MQQRQQPKDPDGMRQMNVTVSSVQFTIYTKARDLVLCVKANKYCRVGTT